VIPEAAVEAAAEWLPHSGDCDVHPERDCTCWQPRVNLIRAALEAAAPHLVAEDPRMDAIAAWCGRYRSGYYDEAQDDVMALLRTTK